MMTYDPKTKEICHGFYVLIAPSKKKDVFAPFTRKEAIKAMKSLSGRKDLVVTAVTETMGEAKCLTLEEMKEIDL